MKKNIMIYGLVTTLTLIGLIVVLALLDVINIEKISSHTKNQNTLEKNIVKEDYNNLYMLITSTHDSSVYGKEEIVKRGNLSNEQKIYNTMKYAYNNITGQINEGKIKVSSNHIITAKYMTLTDINDLAKIFYDENININEHIDYIASKYSQTSEIAAGKTLSGDDVYYYICSDNDSDWKGNCDYLKKIELTDIIYKEMKKVESDFGEVYYYLYDETILNSDIDFGDTEVGSISKFNGEDTLSINDSNFICNKKLIECLHEKFPEYFTTYEHTFKKVNVDGNEYFRYEGTRPIIQGYENATIGKLNVLIPKRFNWCEVTADRNYWACWGDQSFGHIDISREKKVSDIKTRLNKEILNDFNKDFINYKKENVNGIEWSIAYIKDVDNVDIDRDSRYVYATNYGSETYILSFRFTRELEKNSNILDEIIKSVKFEN